MNIPKPAMKPIAILAGALMCACGGGGGSKQVVTSNDVVLPANVSQLTFPKGFLFGAASAAYQTEGAWNKDGRGLTNWDLLTQSYGFANGETGNVSDDQYDLYPEDVALMAKMGLKSYRLSIAWSRIYPTGFPIQLDPATYQPILDAKGNTIPIPPNAAGIAHYNALINLLQANGIEPLVTLYHWDMPIALYGMGGWNNRTVVDLFGAYCQAVFGAFGDRVNYWLTLNEPFGVCVDLDGIMTIAMAKMASGGTFSLSTLMSEFKALSSDTLLGLQMTDLHNYLYASSMATMIMRGMQAQGAVKPTAKIGPVLDLHAAKASSDSPADVAATKLFNECTNDMTLLPLTQGIYPQEVISRLEAEGYTWSLSPSQMAQDLGMMAMAKPDFIGVNYYTRNTVTSTHSDAMFPVFGGLGTGAWFNEAYNFSTAQTPESTQGPYDPQGFYDTLQYAYQKSGGIPLLITENGCNYPGDSVLTEDGQVHDTNRIYYLDGHLKAVWKAINDGMPILGYTQWSLLDDFEWTGGYTPRFGMTYVDYRTPALTRTPKDSFIWYSNVIKNNGMPAN